MKHRNKICNITYRASYDNNIIDVDKDKYI